MVRLVLKERCDNKWSEAQYRSFVKGLLRQGTRKWSPIQTCMREASTRKGFKMCASCLQEVPVTVVDEVKKKRVANVFCDHISPIVPVTGWVSWDDCIEKMFCEKDNLQCLCGSCHNNKSKEEVQQRTEARRNVQ